MYLTVNTYSNYTFIENITDIVFFCDIKDIKIKIKNKNTYLLKKLYITDNNNSVN
jgi:hypothetical protein